MKSDSEKREQITASAVQLMLGNMTDLMFVKDINLVYLSVSHSFARLVGLQDPEQIVGKSDDQLFADPELIKRYTDDDRKLIASGKPLKAYIEPIWVVDGSRGYCQTSKFPIFDELGKIVGLYGVARDVTKEYKARLNYEQELRSLFELPSDALGAALFDITNWRVVDTRIGGELEKKVLSFNTVEEFVADSLDAIVDNEKAREFYRSFSPESLRAMFECGKRRMRIEYRRRMPDGDIHWVENELYFISDPVNGNLCVMSIVRDINEEKQAAKAMARAAQRDALTGIYNRETTMAQIRRFLSEEGADGTHLLFMIDVDNFKLVNDTFGHQTGDEALVHIATAIRNMFGSGDIVGRIGGDEFFVLMKDAYDSWEAGKRAAGLVEALQYEYVVGSGNVELSGSVGISCYSGDEKTLEQLYHEADTALYRAKQAGKNCFIFAESSDSWKEKEPLNAVNLRSLLENMDASVFQTELDSKGDIRVTYLSSSLFSDSGQHTQQSGAQEGNLWSAILPEDLGILKAAIKEAAINETAFDCSCRVKNSIDQIEWRHIRGTQLPDNGDGVCRMLHVATDITPQKVTEADLREKNSIIDLAMRNTDVNLWYVDYETDNCQLTKSFQKAHEMPGIEELENFPECLIENGYVREDCTELFRTKYRQLRESGESTIFDVWLRKADGSGWWCERSMLSPLTDADGTVVRCIGIGKNVTSEKVMEEKFEVFGAYRKLAEKNTRVSFRLNLTTGWFGDCISSTPAVKALYPVDTVEDFFNSLRERVVTEEDIALFDRTLTRELLLDAFMDGETLKSLECHFRDEDNHIIWLRITVEMMGNPVTGDVEGLLYSFDVDHEKSMQFLVNKLLDDDYEFLGIIDVDTGQLMVFGENADKADMARNGYPYEEEMRRVFGGLILNEYYDEGVRIMSIAHVREELRTKKYYTCSFPARDFAHAKAGRKQWKFGYLDDLESKILMTRADITSIYTAEYDPLSGLYNRETFYSHVREMLDENLQKHFLMIRFDIDRFKAYNDVYGAQAGDRLLAAAGKDAREKSWPELAVFGRLEADHFVAVIPVEEFDVKLWSIGHLKWLETVTEGYHLTSSVGIYEITDRSVDIALMCDRALLALRTVKENYTQKVAWYDESLREKLMNEQALADDMEQALTESQFVVYFQPLINYNDNSLIGAEALVRWLHPTRGLIPPVEFIPLFEKNGFILKLDDYVWEKSCQYLRRWLDEGKTIIPVSVNVSRCDLYDPELCGRFEALLEKYQLPITLLKLEITESAYMDDPDQLIHVVNQLRSMGFTVEMDDFGTGYSSLNMLKDMPVDILKLDTRFISESENDSRAITILTAVIQMARQLGLSVIAEGVETKAQADSLKELNCCNMQGYYFGRPMPVNIFEKLLTEGMPEKESLEK